MENQENGYQFYFLVKQIIYSPFRNESFSIP